MQRMRWACAMLLASLTGCASLPSSPTSWFGKTAASQGERDGKVEYTLRMSEAKRQEEAGKWDRARDIYRDMLTQTPDDPVVLHRLGVVADRQKRYADAQQFYTRAIQLDSKNPQLFNDLGYCFFLQGKLKKGERALEKAVAIEPGNARYRNNLGMVVGHQERMEEAFNHFTSAGGEADAYYNVAFIYATKGNDEAAQDCFKLALDADPLHEKARDALAAFQRPDTGEEVVYDDDIRRVRYVEGDRQQKSGEVAQATLSNRDAMDGARALHARAQTLMQRRMASQRGDQQGAAAQQAGAFSDIQ